MSFDKRAYLESLIHDKMYEIKRLKESVSLLKAEVSTLVKIRNVINESTNSQAKEEE